MKVALNPINTNTKSGNSNQVNFKARAELRLSQEFFDKLAALKPQEAANRVQGILDVMGILKRHAFKIEKKENVVVLQDYGCTNPIADFIEQLSVNHCKWMGKDYENKDWYIGRLVTFNDVLSDHRKNLMKATVNNLLKEKGKKQLPIFKRVATYGPYVSLEEGSDTLRRVKFDAKYTKKIGEETTTLAELMAKLKPLLTPVEKQIPAKKVVGIDL